jgi:2-dehydropantoate 2-reductase
LKAPVKTDIRSEIWVKLWGNAVFNPISALTGATLRAICENPGTAQLARTVMREIEQVANALGVVMPVSLDRRMAGAAAIGEHKTSMLQDLEKGRPLELDAVGWPSSNLPRSQSGRTRLQSFMLSAPSG